MIIAVLVLILSGDTESGSWELGTGFSDPGSGKPMRLDMSLCFVSGAPAAFNGFSEFKQVA